MSDITFGGANASDFGIVIEKMPNREIPVRSVGKTDIPNRNGGLLTDNGYFTNVRQEYEIYVKPATGGLAENGRAQIGAWLNSIDPYKSDDQDGYLWLSDTYDTGHSWRAFVSSVSTLENSMNELGRCKVEFERKPQSYNTAGLVMPSTYQATQAIQFPSVFDARPLIKIQLDYDAGEGDYYGTGSVTVSSANHAAVRVSFDHLWDSVQWEAMNGIFYIDCETMQIYCESETGVRTNLARYTTVDRPSGLISYDFPVLKGNNEVNTVSCENCKAAVMRRDFII